jgi:hypothetical protein
MIERIKPKLTYANVMVTLLAFVVLGGGAYAAAKIGAGDIKKDAVRSKHIKNGEVRSGDLDQQGIPRDVEIIEGGSGVSSANKSAQIECPPGKLPIGGGADAPTIGATGFVALTTSRPAFTTEPPDDFNGWRASAIEVNGGSTQIWGIDLYVICARGVEPPE